MSWGDRVIFAALVIGALLAISVFIVALSGAMGDKNSFIMCDEKYEKGDCLLYECKMNHSVTIEVQRDMYSLYHTCIIAEGGGL